MEAFRLHGTIDVDNDKANGALQETSIAGQKAESRLNRAFKGIGNAALKAGKVIGTGFAAGTVAVGKMFVDGMKLAGELEQQLGGSEAVFGEYARAMQAQGKYAFSTMGLSQAEFLATANKMGSLLQGSGFEAKEATDLTMTAMQRAADVASIMGIDVSSAMEAIAGACKGNFTMMDNLGVAINDTALANYALEKGIKKSTSQMTTQEKVSLAMELFLEKSAYAAGNYSKENDTLAGSLNTAKAALQNFLSGAGDADDVVKTFSNAADVIAKNAVKLAPALAKGLSSIIKGLTPKIGGLLQAALPGILEGAVSLLVGLSQALPDLASVLVEQIPYIVSQLAAAAEVALPAIADAVITMFEGIVNNLPAILQSIGQIISSVWGSGIWPMVQGLFKAVFGIELPDWVTLKETIETKTKELYDTAKDWLKAEFGITLPDFEEIGQSITTWWNTQVLPSIKDLFNAVFSIFTEDDDGKTVGQRIIDWGGKVLAAVGNIFSTVFGITLPDFEAIGRSIADWWNKMVLPSIRDYFKTLFGIELPSFEDVASSISTWWNDTMTTVGEVFSKLFSIELPTIDDIVSAIQTWWNDITSKVSLGLTAFWNGITSGGEPEDLGNGFTEYPSGKVVPTGAVRKANGLDFVSRDQMPAILHYGEAVLNRTDAKAWRDGSGNAGMIELAGKMDAMLQVLESGFSNMGGQQIVLDSGVLVGSLSNGIDSRLGRLATYRSRRG